MKIKNQKNKKIIIITILISLIVVGAIFGVIYFMKKTPDSESNVDNTENGQIVKTNKSQTKKIEDSSINDKNKTNTDTPAPIIEDSDTGKKVVQMVSSADISGHILYIRGGINNSVEYAGICYAELSGPNGENLKKDTTLLQNAATTDCKTIQVDTTGLSKGSWKVVLKYSSNEIEGASGEITIEIS